ncbi:RNA polymerase sigma factor [Actinomadura viridis]|uniref:RNA polymerase sigma factor n=1 Tax=Actinomadura viridis TaxID=58110 RepID=A0A931DEV0_9ACTN|nr:DUF6596 domain-containing protein [Actinomadura viridis]MBG6087027.1 putative RNA polymerase sigma factor [Actinomadura viridis]
MEAVWRAEAPRVMAALVRYTRDLGEAEEFAQEALERALETWPTSGVPEYPAAWLVRAGKNKAIDRWRRQEIDGKAMSKVAGAVVTEDDGGIGELLDDLHNPFDDELLQMLFTACHPVLNREYRTAMVLRCVVGLRTTEIARAYLVSDAVIGRRISRAKRVLRDKNIRLEMPGADQVTERAGTVIEVIYLLFNEGYAPLDGDDWVRPELIREALRIGRLVARLLPSISEVHGLLALMELTHARTAARTAPDGSPVLLQDQDRTRWDRTLIRRGVASLARARHVGGALGPFTIQAAIAAEHMLAPSADDTDHARIAGLYDMLAIALPTPVVQLNRAVARGRAGDPAHGLALIDEIDAAGLRGYPHLPGARGELLALAGRRHDAAVQFAEAVRLSRNRGEQALFRARLAALGVPGSPEPTAATRKESPGGTTDDPDAAES